MYKYILLILFLNISVFGQSNQGLVAHYPMNGDGTDASKNKNTGTLKGRVSETEDRFGNLCGALYFNGSDAYIEVPDSRSLSSPRKELSISVWFKLSASADQLQWVSVCSKGNSDEETINSPHYRFQTTNKTVSVNTVFTENWTVSPQNDKWYHYVLTFQTPDVKVYLDGKKVFEYSLPMELLPNNEPLDIGRDLPGNQEYFQGSLDDMRIYNRTLSAKEILQLYKESQSKSNNSKGTLTKMKDIRVIGNNDCCQVVNFSPPSYKNSCLSTTIKQTSGPVTGECFPVGKTEVSFGVYSNGKLLEDDSFYVIVEDRKAPIINCLGNIELECPANSSSKVVYYDIEADDNCNLKELKIIKGLESGEAFPIGETIVKYKAIDQAGNSSTCEFVVNIQPSEMIEEKVVVHPPSIKCIDDIYTNTNSEAGTPIYFGKPKVTNSDPSAQLNQVLGRKSGELFTPGVHEIAYEYIDINGTKLDCSFSIYVNLNEKPIEVDLIVEEESDEEEIWQEPEDESDEEEIWQEPEDESDEEEIWQEPEEEEKQLEVEETDPIIPQTKKIRIRETLNQNPKIPRTWDNEPILYKEHVVLEESIVYIILYDHKRTDNDKVSIYLNGDEILKKTKLEPYTIAKQNKIKVVLNKTEPNYFLIKAHNLGKIPPNTCTVKILDENLKELETHTLNSYPGRLTGIILKTSN